MNILLIVASGKSSRFGGFPKAFCQIGQGTNVDNTVQKAGVYFGKIYIGVNRDTYERFGRNVAGCEMFSIKTGQGDAHSLLKCLAHVRERERKIDKLAVCWGDAVFVDSLPFRELLAEAGETEVAVACAVDDKPYAWFETDKNNGIVRSHFANKEGYVEKGLHDQSLFLFSPDFAWKYLNEYRESLGIPYDNDESAADINEMKLLFSFEFLCRAGYKRAKCIEVTKGNVLSFNTQEELEWVKKALVEHSKESRIESEES